MASVNPIEEPSKEEPSQEPEKSAWAEPPPKPVEVSEPAAESKPVTEAAKEEKQPDSLETKYSKVQAALREERNDSRHLKNEMSVLKGRLDQFDGLRTELDEHRKQSLANVDQESFDNNPAEYLRDAQAKLSDNVNKMHAASEKNNQDAIQHQQFMAGVQSQTQAFASQTPDYSEALAYMQDRRMKEYEVVGVPKEQWELRFQQESIQFAANAVQQNRNPAELAYQLAGVHGYVKKQGKAEESGADNNKAIDRLEAGHRAAKTLSNQGRGEESLLKSIDAMSESEFDKYWDSDIVPPERR